jgi:hypothetical protein
MSSAGNIIRSQKSEERQSFNPDSRQLLEFHLLKPGHEVVAHFRHVPELLLLPLQALTSCYISFVFPAAFPSWFPSIGPAIDWKAREFCSSSGGVTNGS